MNETTRDVSQAFLRAIFRGILHKEPEDGSLEAAVGEIEKGVPYEVIIQGILASQGPRRKAGRKAPPGTSSSKEIVMAMYRGILNREPEERGIAGAVKQIEEGVPYEVIFRGMIASAEFQSKHARRTVPAKVLPNLVKLMPEYYDITEKYTIFKAAKDGAFDLLEGLIEKHRYYDSFGVWMPKIDLDKMIIAATVRGLGAQTVFELGCFTGTVLSLLQDAGLEVTGMDLSHLAFAFAYPNIRSRMIYGDLLEHKLDKKFDVILAMDILEHLNPLKLDRYISRLATMLNPDGFMYLNSPMFGPDDVFGNPTPPYLPEWKRVGDASYWRTLHCDQKGWPANGHLVWASPVWWERLFQQHGLVRDRQVEIAIHQVLGEWFKLAHGRLTFFVLKRPTNRQPSAKVAERVAATLEKIPNFPRSSG